MITNMTARLDPAAQHVITDEQITQGGVGAWPSDDDESKTPREILTLRLIALESYTLDEMAKLEQQVRKRRDFYEEALKRELGRKDAA